MIGLQSSSLQDVKGEEHPFYGNIDERHIDKRAFCSMAQCDRVIKIAGKLAVFIGTLLIGEVVAQFGTVLTASRITNLISWQLKALHPVVSKLTVGTVAEWCASSTM